MEPARFAKCAGLVSASVGRMICIFWQWESLGRNAGANADLTDDPARIEWREFYELPRYGMVRAFEGAYMYARDIWRPETNSCMNNNVSYFNAPSRKKIVERIMELSGRSFDMNDFLAKDAINLSTSARSRLREPRAGELFVPFAPPVLTVGTPRRSRSAGWNMSPGKYRFLLYFTDCWRPVGPIPWAQPVETDDARA